MRAMLAGMLLEPEAALNRDSGGGRRCTSPD
jgi:hypothetical protein